MGITGLLPCLRSITTKVHIREYQGLTAGIDGYCWLHRGAYACCMELALGKETDKYVKYCMDRVQCLIREGITPLVVFDGASLPAKRETNLQRRTAREENRANAMDLYEEGQKTEARALFHKAISITHDMARKLMKALKAAGVRFIVAPYEADAQLAYLSIKGTVHLVITEDSDAIPYGCRRVLFKLDREGNAEEIERRNLGANQELDFLNWTDNMFLDMCLLAGCDYLPSIPGLGIKTAYRLIKQHRSYKKVLQALRLLTDVRVPSGYADLFVKARMTFRHHLVYDPDSQSMVPLNSFLESHVEMDLSFLGRQLEPEVAHAVAVGELHPQTCRPYSPPEDQAGGGDLRSDGASSAQGAVTSAQPAVVEEDDVQAKESSSHHQIVPSWSSRSAELGATKFIAAKDAENLSAAGIPPITTFQSLGSSSTIFSSLQGGKTFEMTARAQHDEDALQRAMRAMSGSSKDAILADLPSQAVRATARFPFARLTPLNGSSAPREHRSDVTQASAPVAQAPMQSQLRSIMPPPPPRCPLASRSLGVSVDGCDHVPDEGDHAEGGLRGGGREASVVRTSSYFHRATAPTRGGQAHDVQAMLQRLQDVPGRSRTQQQQPQPRQRAPNAQDELDTHSRRPADRRKSSNTAGTSFRAPMTSLEFESPIVSQQVETLYRRHKRNFSTADVRDSMDPQGPSSKRAPAMRDSRTRRAEDAAGDHDDRHHAGVEFVPRFSARHSEPASPVRGDSPDFNDPPHGGEGRISTFAVSPGSGHDSRTPYDVQPAFPSSRAPICGPSAPTAAIGIRRWTTNEGERDEEHRDHVSFCPSWRVSSEVKEDQRPWTGISQFSCYGSLVPSTVANTSHSIAPQAHHQHHNHQHHPRDVSIFSSDPIIHKYEEMPDEGRTHVPPFRRRHDDHGYSLYR